MDQPGPDRRHRDTTGRISEKHGQTRIGTLRRIYGPRFADGYPDSARLKDVLHKLDTTSLLQLYKHHDTGVLEGKIIAATDAADDAPSDTQRPRH